MWGDSVAEDMAGDYGPAVLDTFHNVSGFALKYADAKYRGDREYVKAAVQDDGLALEFASTAVRDDFDVVLVAVAERLCAAV